MEMIILLVVAIIIAAVIVYFLKRRSGGGSMRLSRLYAECQKQLHLPPETAKENIDDFVRKMQQKYPGHSQEWYLEKILTDLKRDRR